MTKVVLRCATLSWLSRHRGKIGLFPGRHFSANRVAFFTVNWDGHSAAAAGGSESLHNSCPNLAYLGGWGTYIPTAGYFWRGNVSEEHHFTWAVSLSLLLGDNRKWGQAAMKFCTLLTLAAGPGSLDVVNARCGRGIGEQDVEFALGRMRAWVFCFYLWSPDWYTESDKDDLSHIWVPDIFVVPKSSLIQNLDTWPIISH